MPQMQLPFFPDGVEHITSELAFEKRDGQVIYFNGHMPVFIHAEGDIATFRMITAQFCINGNAKQADIARAFGVTLISVKRAVKLYRDKGVSGFYEEPNRRGPAVLTEEVLKEAQERLDQGLEISEVAEQLAVKGNTLAKAIRAGRLHKRAKKKTSTHRSAPRANAAAKTRRRRWGWGRAMF
jgi:transposase